MNAGDPSDSPKGSAAEDRASARRKAKSPNAFRTISEVADELQIPQHVLRFWESRFPQIKPLKRGGGRRYYRPDDIALLRRIGDLLYVQGYTIKGVQRLLRDGGEGEGNEMAEDDQLGSVEPDADATPPVGEPSEASQFALFRQAEAKPPKTPRRARSPRADASAEPQAQPEPQDDAAELARLRTLLREAGRDLASIAAELRKLKGQFG